MPGLDLTLQQIAEVLQGKAVHTEDTQEGFLEVRLLTSEDAYEAHNAHLEQAIGLLDLILGNYDFRSDLEADLKELRQALVDA